MELPNILKIIKYFKITIFIWYMRKGKLDSLEDISGIE
jgi:hypothetical protein